jgi:hypothetical protein
MITPHPHNVILPYGLITFGAIYIAKPDIFYMWMSKRNAAAQRRPMPEQNKSFMRVLGLICLIAGFVLLMRST